MDIAISFTDQAIPRPATSFTTKDGAVVEFWGVVRGDEGSEAIAGLKYEIYEPMAGKVARRLIEELSSTVPCTAMLVIHRIGMVPAGEASIYVRVSSRHRGEAFRMLEQFMTRMKSEVPIWKEPVAC